MPALLLIRILFTISFTSDARGLTEISITKDKEEWMKKPNAASVCVSVCVHVCACVCTYFGVPFYIPHY